MNAEQFDALLDHLNRKPDAAYRLAEVLVGHIRLEDGRIEADRYWLNRLEEMFKMYEAKAQPKGEGL